MLKNGPVGIHDNFFDRGGHSLKATALVSRIAKEFDVQVPLKDRQELAGRFGRAFRLA